LSDKQKPNDKGEAWDRGKGMFGDSLKSLGQHWSYNLINDPKRLAFVLSRYKFAAKMGSAGKDVLELGCSEGVGAQILSESAATYTGVDMDSPAIKTAMHNWRRDSVKFIESDFLGKSFGKFDTIVSMDVVEHIMPESEHLFFDTLTLNLKPDGIAIIGTPNKTSEVYASETSKAGHINLFDAPRLRRVMMEHFHNVFMFGMNDEIVHTGFAPMTHFLVSIGCGIKEAS
jgi:2-polyprenyl-3-methyl-5-hydroxy-6-metoxy-1,4-benzoquinol methylase